MFNPLASFQYRSRFTAEREATPKEFVYMGEIKRMIKEASKENDNGMKSVLGIILCLRYISINVLELQLERNRW